MMQFDSQSLTISVVITIICVFAGVECKIPCDICIRKTTEFKEDFSQEIIDTQTAILANHCKQEMADTDLFKCLERVRVIKEDLEYILNHSAEETCKYFEFCPSTRVSLSPMVEQSFKKFALNKNFATKAKTIGVTQFDYMKDMKLSCQECRNSIEELKADLTHEKIDQAAENISYVCRQDSKLSGCVEGAEKFKQELEYILDHSTEDSCKSAGLCPRRLTDPMVLKHLQD